MKAIEKVQSGDTPKKASKYLINKYWHDLQSESRMALACYGLERTVMKISTLGNVEQLARNKKPDEIKNPKYVANGYALQKWYKRLPPEENSKLRRKMGLSAHQSFTPEERRARSKKATTARWKTPGEREKASERLRLRSKEAWALWRREHDKG